MSVFSGLFKKKPVKEDLSQEDYLRRFQSNEKAEQVCAALHLPEAYVFLDDIRLGTGSSHEDVIRNKQAMFYELGKLVGYHPRFDTLLNLEKIRAANSYPQTLYDGTGMVPDDNLVIAREDISLKFSGMKENAHIIYKGQRTDAMDQDLIKGIARSIRLKAAYVLKNLSIPLYETELTSAVWEMTGRSCDKQFVYDLVMYDAPEGDDTEPLRRIKYGRDAADLVNEPGDIGRAAQVCLWVEAWLDCYRGAANDEDVPLYDVLLPDLFSQFGIAEKVRRRQSGEAWKNIWKETGRPSEDKLASWDF